MASHSAFLANFAYSQSHDSETILRSAVFHSLVWLAFFLVPLKLLLHLRILQPLAEWLQN
jgi:hypothetical protein